MLYKNVAFQWVCVKAGGTGEVQEVAKSVKAGGNHPKSVKAGDTIPDCKSPIKNESYSFFLYPSARSLLIVAFFSYYME